jgi:hypothetical protein
MTESTQFSLREFLRARRPERFSDSGLVTQQVLDRNLLEYHLSTLTNRSQETDFQNFARRLAEKEVCPNLLPQTGPTGGGDSKVDTETYPVADDLAVTWYVGSGREAATERWAFAISAKEEWRGKVRSDVQKIADTNRGYTKAFFITNQFVRDRDRADMEKELTDQHGMDVRIFDRTWILDRVFGGRHESLAIDELRMQPSLRPQVIKGPQDLTRERALEEIEEKIRQTAQELRFGVQYADDCVEAADLSRCLERPRSETDGRFIRAEHAATKYGTRYQQLRCAYEYAWTACFWYEDFPLAAKLYSVVEEKASGTRNAYELELVGNLWKVLVTTVRTGNLDVSIGDLEKRTKTLFAELERLADQTDRPSNSLYAKSLLILDEMLIAKPEDINRHLDALNKVIQQSEGLIGFPLEPLLDILGEIGEVLGAHSSYDVLYETMIKVATAREGDLTGARLLLRRGSQHLEADRPVEAVRLLGRGLGRLHKHESRHDLVRALSLCGAAYERLGLLWAARGTTLAAASVATGDFWKYEEITLLQAACYRRMKWLELQLGRLPHILAWHDLDHAVRAKLVEQGYDEKRLAHGEVDFGAILAILILKTELWELKWISSLPEVLDDLELPVAADSLRYALGHPVEFPPGLIEDNANEDSVLKFFIQLRDQPAARELPNVPAFCDGQTVVIESKILGCRVSVDCDNEHHCVAVAESVLAALESLLASGIVDGLVAREPKLTVRVRNSSFGEDPISFELLDRNGYPHLEIRCCVFDPNSLSAEGQGHLKTKISDLVGNVIARIVFFANFEESLDKLFGEDRALERAIAFTASFVVQGNVLGTSPPTDMSRWRDQAAKDYPLIREKAWDVGMAASGHKKQAESEPKVKGGGGTARDDIEQGRIRHSQIEMASPIREAFWNEAGWVGNGFIWFEGEGVAPIFAPIFQNEIAATKIFENWHREYGEIDQNDAIRITIIRGISKANPCWYRVVIGGDFGESGGADGKKLVVVMSRHQTMTPDSDKNLTTFLSAYRAAGRYVVGPCIWSADGQPVPIGERVIGKTKLHVRDAWQIGVKDIDGIGILPTDDPIIPSEQPGAPVLELLRQKRSR